MKKSILIFGFALALASCASDSYEGWSDPQHSDPEASKDVKLAIGNAPGRQRMGLAFVCDSFVSC